MSRRRRKKNGGVEDAILGFALLFGGAYGLQHGGSIQALLRGVFIWAGVFLAAGVALILAIRAIRDNTAVAGEPEIRTPRRRGSTASGRRRGTPAPRRIEPSTRPRAEPPRPVMDRRPDDWSLATLRALEWKRFEEVCEGFWKAKGYPAEMTGPGADGGVDVLIRDRNDASRVFAVIQCKAYGNKPVGVEPVRALWGSKDHFGAQLALFYGLSGFTPDAERFAAEKHLRLISGERLLEQIRLLTPQQQFRLLTHVTRDDYRTPTCASCDIKMVLRRGDKGDFWGCRNYPKCRSAFSAGTKASTFDL